jgi:integrase
MKITAKAVATLTAPPEGKTDVIYFDEGMPGFGLRVRWNGGEVRRNYVAQYRTHGRTRRVLIGSAETVTAEQARTKAKGILAQAALGGDPQAAKQEKRDRDETTLRAVIREFLAAKNDRRPRTKVELERYLAGDLYLKPLHHLSIDAITRKDIAARLLTIEREHTRAVAWHVRSKLSGLFSWAMQMGLAQTNPVVGTANPKLSPGRERVLDDDELAEVWRACGEDDAGWITKLLILTGCRRSEIGGLRWSELDRERETWTLPATRAKNHRAHTLPLPPAAWRIIEVVQSRHGRDQLFGGRSTAGFTLWDHAKRALDERLGDKVRPWTYHDLRRTVATRMADIGVPPHIIEAALNHVSGHRSGVAGIYNRSTYEREIRNALATWAEHVTALVKGRASKVAVLNA